MKVRTGASEVFRNFSDPASVAQSDVLQSVSILLHLPAPQQVADPLPSLTGEGPVQEGPRGQGGERGGAQHGHVRLQDYLPGPRDHAVKHWNP